MKRKTITAALMALAIAALQITVPASADFYSDRGETYDSWNSLILGTGYYYVDDGYDVQFTPNSTDDIDGMAWIMNYIENIDGYELTFNSNFESCRTLKVKVPDSCKAEASKSKPAYVKVINGSCGFKEFDLNPQNKYMKLNDNVLFSKDGTTLMSYAQFDKRKIYSIPDGTEVIGKEAFERCNNITRLSIPESVKRIQSYAFWSMDALEEINISPLVSELDKTFGNCKNLKEVYIPENSKLKKIKGAAFGFSKISTLMLPSFEVEIDKTAFVGCENNVSLKSYVKPNAKAVYLKSSGKYKLKWDKISNASGYEVYQKSRDGSYKLLKTVRGTSIKLNGIKSGKKYTFAVKPISEIEAFGEAGQYLHYDLPEYYTIEGTMSDDVTFKAK